MNLDFASILLILTLVSGAIWAIDRLLFAKKRQAAKVGSDKEPVLVEYARSFFPVFLVVLILRSFIVEPYRIPSGSMLPTLLVGDFILVNKYEYGLRLPLFHTKVWGEKQPERGDVAVFRHPKTQVNYIKRVIGVPGDVVRYENKQLYVNDVAASYQPNGQFVVSGNIRTKLSETLDGVTHDVLHNPYIPGRRSQEWQVPEGHYFVMGDNRDNSADSRTWGVFPDKDLLGEAFGIWMSWNSDSDDILPINWDRIGMGIK